MISLFKRFIDWFLSLFSKKSGPVDGDSPLGNKTVNFAMYLAKPSVSLNDPIRERRFDLGNYVLFDAFKVADNSFITAWSFPPFEKFVPENGDGGEQYAIEDRVLYIDYTRDGGKPYNQYFGKGWIVARDDPTYEWKSIVAIGPDGDKHFTRYCLRSVSFPVLGGTVNCIISEHYDGPTIKDSSNMERIFLGYKYGRLCWQAFNKGGPKAGNVLEIDPTRAPDFGWNTVEGWSLYDTRVSTNLIPVDGHLTGHDLWQP